MTMNDWQECVECGDDIAAARWAMGYRVCLRCGEAHAREARRSWTVVQEYGKGCYQYITKEAAFTTLRQTNQKYLR